MDEGQTVRLATPAFLVVTGGIVLQKPRSYRNCFHAPAAGFSPLDARYET